MLGKAYVGKQDREKAEEMLLQAQIQITSVYGEEHTLAAKYNQYLIEAYNLRDESPERTELINRVSEKNVEICKKHYGDDSIFQIRVLYTNYTARLHDSIEESQKLIEQMKNMTYRGTKLGHNQFTFKAMIVDATIGMQMGPQPGKPSTDEELGNIFERQQAYLEGDAYHPFLEEVV